MRKLKYVSLFSGIEAATVAWRPLGWEPIAFCEIDPFPSAVLKHHYPNVPNLGDITKVDWTPYVGTADIVVGGSPCQSFSIAGKREGLAGASGLMFEYIRAVRELRPAWFVWENVPGALSSERGGSYRQLLSEMDALGYGLAWRVLDAEFFDVPQRRERLFLVGHLGDQRAAEVLFDEQGLSWDFTSGREKRKALAQAARGGVGDADQGVGGNLTRGENQARRVYSADGVSPTLAARGGSGQNQQAVLTVQTANTNSNGSPVKDGQVADTLDTNNSMAVAFNTNTGVSGHAGSLAISEDTSPTLKTDHAPAVLPFAQNQRNEIRETPVSGALAARPGKNQTYVCRMDMAVNSAADEDCAGTLTAHAFKANPYIYPSEGTAVNPEPPVTLQVRCGKPEGGGKGALAQTDMSATLSTGNMQVPITPPRKETAWMTTRRPA